MPINNIIICNIIPINSIITCNIIPINQPTRCNNLSSLLLDVYVRSNMFRASSRPSSGATTAVSASGLPSELGDSSAVGRGRAGRPDDDQQHCCHLAPTVNQKLILQLL